MTAQPARPTFELRVDGARNLVRIRFLGHVTVADMTACTDQVKQHLPEMRPGFIVLTDLSDLESMDLECATPLAKIMDLSRARGVGTVIRVIPDRGKDIGLNILSIIHYRRGVKLITCDTLAEAEHALNS